MTRKTFPVYIQANERMTVPAQVAGHSFARWSTDEVEIVPHLLYAEKLPALAAREGMDWLQGDVRITYRLDDLCSFMPTRMAPPSLMGFEGRCLIIDPDMFAVRSPIPLLTMDMQDKAIWAAPPPEYRDGPYETSLMLVDTSKVRHWVFDEMLERICAGEMDYGDWERLRYEDPGSVGTLGNEWNCYDAWHEDTRIVHNTNYLWWPWKRGRDVEYWEHRLWVRTRMKPRNVGRLLVKALRRRFKAPAVYEGHPNPRIEENFIRLLAEAIDCGRIDRSEVQASIDRGHVRGDLLEVTDRQSLAAK